MISSITHSLLTSVSNDVKVRTRLRLACVSASDFKGAARLSRLLMFCCDYFYFSLTAGSPALYFYVSVGMKAGQSEVRRLSIWCVLVFNILPKTRDCDPTTRCYEIGLIPEHIFPVSVINFLGKFLPNSTTRNGFEAIDEFW